MNLTTCEMPKKHWASFSAQFLESNGSEHVNKTKNHSSRSQTVSGTTIHVLSRNLVPSINQDCAFLIYKVLIIQVCVFQKQCSRNILRTTILTRRSAELRFRRTFACIHLGEMNQIYDTTYSIVIYIFSMALRVRTFNHISL